MRSVYIQPTAEAATLLFTRGSDADFELMDTIDAENSAAAEEAYNAVMGGAVASIETDAGLIVLSRSLRGDFVQVSRFLTIDNTYEATSHNDAHNATEILDNIPDGIYINIEEVA